MRDIPASQAPSGRGSVIAMLGGAVGRIRVRRNTARARTASTASRAAPTPAAMSSPAVKASSALSSSSAAGPSGPRHESEDQPVGGPVWVAWREGTLTDAGQGIRIAVRLGAGK